MLFRCLLISVLVCFISAYNPVKVPVKRDTQKYCGHELANALQMICDGIYNTMFKRTFSSYYQNFKPPNDVLELSAKAMFPFNPRHQALSLLPNLFVRQTRGVYDECCRKSCSLQELATYCGSG